MVLHRPTEMREAAASNSALHGPPRGEVAGPQMGVLVSVTALSIRSLPGVYTSHCSNILSMGNHNFAQLLILLLNLGTLLSSLACPYCPYPTPPSKPPKLPPKYPPKHPPKVKPPHVPKPPPTPKIPPYIPKPPPYEPKPPVVVPPTVPKPPIVHPPIVYPPVIPKPPIIYPPVIPKPPIVYPPVIPKPPIVYPPVIPKPPIIYPPVIPKPPIVYPPVIPKPPIIYPPLIPTPPVVPNPPVVTPPPETPCPPPPTSPKANETCPIDTLKLGACVDVLKGLVHIGIGSSAKDTCCPVLEGLVGLDAAICLCTTIKAKLLNINILIPIALQVLIECGKTPPSGFQCPA